LIAVNPQVIQKIKEFAASQKVYYEPPKKEDKSNSVFDGIFDGAGEAISAAASNAVNFFKNNPKVILIFLMIMNIIPWIILLFYDNLSEKVFNASTPALILVLTVILFNVFLFPSVQILGSVCFILWLISIIGFAIFVIAWLVSHIARGGSSKADKEKRYKEFERRRKEFLGHS